MDTSTTEAGTVPYGETAALISGLKLLQSIKPGMNAREQVTLLRDVIACLQSWHRIKNLGVSTLNELFERHTAGYFEAGSFVPLSFGHTRVIPLITPLYSGRDNIIGSHTPLRDYYSLFLFLTESGSIIGLNAHSKDIGGDIRKAHKVQVVYPVTDDMLIEFIEHTEGLKGNRRLVLTAAETLTQVARTAESNALEKALGFGKVRNMMSMIMHAVKEKSLVST